jgi:mono/diheme cytochrome c family protein
MHLLRPLAIAALLCAACSPHEEKPLSESARRGEKIYQNVCIACHNGDPNRDGALGPANAGSSEELLEAKVLRGEYPPGYTPKRPDSHAMPRFEHLANEIPALAAYLREMKNDGAQPQS